jgi:UDP-glucose 4-epimerase
VTSIAGGRPVTIFGDGEQSRDFTYVGNVVDATLRAGHAEGASGSIFNVAAGAPGSVNLLADTIGKILDKPVEKHYAEPRPGDVRDSWADISGAERVLGYRAEVGFEDGLRRTIDFLRG